MKARTTLVLVALLALAFAAIKLLGPRPEEVHPGIQPLFPGLTPEVVKRLDLHLFSGEEVAVVQKGATRFEVRIKTRSAPIVDRGNESRIRHLLESLVGARREDLPEPVDRATLETLGLASQPLVIRMETDQQTWDLELGNDDPGGNACFARFAGENRVFRTGRNLKNILQFNAQNFRFDRIFSFSALGIDALQIEHPASKEHPDGLLIMLEKSALGWKLTEPFDARADDSRAMAAINGLSRALIKSWPSEQSDPQAMRLFAMNEPILVTLASGAALETVEFGLWDEAMKVVYARKVGQENIVAVDASYLDALRREPEDFRMKRLLRPLGERLTSLEVKLQGKIRYSLQAATAGNYRILKPFNCLAETEGKTDSMRWLIRRLEAASAKAFVDLTQLDLGRPFGTIEIHWRERDVPLRVTLSVFDQDGRLLVQRDDEPAVGYEVEDEFRELITLDPVRIKERRLVPYDKEWGKKVVRAELEVGDESLIIERSKGGFFEAKDLPKRRTANLQSFFGSLIHRRAVRYLPTVEVETLGEDGLGPWRARLILTEERGEKTKLELFAKTGEGHLLRLTLPSDESSTIVAIADDELAHDFLEAIKR